MLWIAFILLVILTRHWCRRRADSAELLNSDTYGRFYRRVLAQMTWRTVLLTLLVGLAIGFLLSENAASGGYAAGLCFGLYPFLFLFILFFVHRAAKERFDEEHEFTQGLVGSHPDEDTRATARALDQFTGVLPSAHVRSSEKIHHSINLAKFRYVKVSLGLLFFAAVLLIIRFALSKEAATPRTRDATPIQAAVTPVGSSTAASSASRVDPIVARLQQLGIKPSEAFRQSAQALESAFRDFIAASNKVDSRAVISGTANTDLIANLKAIRQASLHLLHSADEYLTQVRADLNSNKTPDTVQGQIMAECKRGSEHIRQAALAGVNVADAGIDVQNDYSEGIEARNDEERFIDACNRFDSAGRVLFESGRETQRKNDQLFENARDTERKTDQPIP